MPVFGVIINKQVETFKFRNSYRVLAANLTLAKDAVIPLATFESKLMFAAVDFTYGNVFVLNSEDPTDFIKVYTTNIIGERSWSGGPALPEVCAFCALTTVVGTNGKKSYRYTFSKSEVSGEGGQRHADMAELQAIFPAASIDLMEALSDLDIGLEVGGSPSGVGSRSVAAVDLNGMTLVKTNKVWYNQPGEP